MSEIAIAPETCVGMVLVRGVSGRLFTLVTEGCTSKERALEKAGTVLDMLPLTASVQDVDVVPSESVPEYAKVVVI